LTTLHAEVISDSIGIVAPRLTTFKLRYPWIIHSEAQTHRVISLDEDTEIVERTPSLMADKNLSRNAGSTRAIPVKKMIDSVLSDPYVPLFWGKNQKGMQAGEELSPAEVQKAKMAWMHALDNTVASARELDAMGIHKQQINRLLAPFSHITVVVSGTEWSNFYALRRHGAAEPHIRMLADAMWHAQFCSSPKLLGTSEWHLPFVGPQDWERAWQMAGGSMRGSGARMTTPEQIKLLVKLSTARCASTSYKTVDGFDMTIERAAALHDKLVADIPLHASPAEHQAQPDGTQIDRVNDWMNSHLHGNLVGWRQYRKSLPGESQ
jgi:hypothetical protein